MPSWPNGPPYSKAGSENHKSHSETSLVAGWKDRLNKRYDFEKVPAGKGGFAYQHK
jgi:hypothetical protein